MKTYNYINRVVLTLPLLVYEGTWTTLSPLVYFEFEFGTVSNQREFIKSNRGDVALLAGITVA